MNNFNTLRDTLKKAPLPNNSLTAKKEWEQAVDNILATKPIVLNSTKTVDSSVVHLDPITIPKGATLNYAVSQVTEDITFTALASGSIPMVGIRMSFNEPISTKANANTWLIPNVVLEAENQTINPSGTTLPTTSPDFSLISNESQPQLQGYITLNSMTTDVGLVNGNGSAFTGSLIQTPLLTHPNDYNGALGDSNVIGRGNQLLITYIGYDRAHIDYGSYYTGSQSNLISVDNVQDPIFNNTNTSFNPAGLQAVQTTQGMEWYDSNPNRFSDAIYKELVSAINKSWNLRNFDEETEIYMSLYFLSFEIDQAKSDYNTPNRLENEIQAGTVGAFVNFTPLTIETPGEVTFSTTIINN